MKFWNFGRKSQLSSSQNAVQDPAEARRKARAYQGAVFNRLVSDWIAQSTSGDAEVRSSLRALRNRARQLGRDNDYVKAFFRAVQNNVVGTGIDFQSHVQLPNGEPNEALNEQIEREWKRWTRKENCHVAGKLNFTGLERLAVKTAFESGEIYVRMVSKRFGKSKVPLSLQLIEGDQINDDMNGIAENGNEIRMGVEHNEWGRPVAYYVRSYHPGDFLYSQNNRASNDPIRIPAEEMFPLMMHDRVGQTRGVPALVTAILRLHHMSGTEEAEVVTARATAALMGFIENPEGEASGDAVVDGERVTDFEPGVFRYLQPGERVTVPDLKRPSGQFYPFIRTMIRGVASGLGASYETLSSDYSQSNYSSTRQSLLTERDNWKIIQNWMIDNFHQIIFEKWLDMAVLSGVIQIRDYELFPEKYQDVTWMPRGWDWIDPSKDVDASIAAIDAGLDSHTDVLARAGKDFEKIILQKKREMAFAKKHGVPLNLGPRILQNQTQPQQVDTEIDENEDPRFTDSGNHSNEENQNED